TPDAERGGDVSEHELRLRDRGELDPGRAIAKSIRGYADNLDGKSGFSASPRPGDRDEPSGAEEITDSSDFPLASNERRERRRGMGSERAGDGQEGGHREPTSVGC